MKKFKVFFLSAVLMLIGLSTVALGAASQIGAGGVQDAGAFYIYPVTVKWLGASDTSCAVRLPDGMGAPSGILQVNWYDLDTAGKASAAMSGGEGIYAIPRGTGEEFVNYTSDEYAGAVAGSLSVYRVDLDGNDTLQTSVVTEIFFTYNKYGYIF